MKSVRNWGLAYALTLVVFIVVDAGWIAGVVVPMYQKYMGDILGDGFYIPAAIAFYLIYCAGMVYFAIKPLDRETSLRKKTLDGALYGFFTYSTWALTFKAAIAGMPWSVAIADIAWGVVLGAVTTFIASWIMKQASTTKGKM